MPGTLKGAHVNLLCAARHVAQLWLDISQLGTHRTSVSEGLCDLNDWIEHSWEACWRSHSFPKQVDIIENMLAASDTSVTAANCQSARALIKLRECGASIAFAIMDLDHDGLRANNSLLMSSLSARIGF